MARTWRLVCAGSMAVAAAALVGCGGVEDGRTASAIVSSAPATGQLDDQEATALTRQACAGATKNHGDCVSCAAHFLDGLRRDGRITGAQEGRVTSIIAREGCVADPPPCVPLSCADFGSTCGPIDDGCGGTLDCACPAGDYCSVGLCRPADQY